MKKTGLTEQELVLLLKAKDKKAFDILYKRYAQSLYNIILKIVHCRDLADDVLQDSFTKIWLHIPGYNAARGSLFTWVMNIARNTAIDKIRSLAYQNRSLFCSLEVNVADKQFTIQQQTDFIGVDTLINLLSPPHQALVRLIYLQGYTHEEAAEALAMPLGTAKSRLKVAITRLKEQLNEPIML